MAMTNIAKIQLINATENCLLDIFSVRNYSLPTELFFIHLILIWTRPRGLDNII